MNNLLPEEACILWTSKGVKARPDHVNEKDMFAAFKRSRVSELMDILCCQTIMLNTAVAVTAAAAAAKYGAASVIRPTSFFLGDFKKKTFVNRMRLRRCVSTKDTQRKTSMTRPRPT